MNILYKKKLGQLHCGACMEDFSNIDDLNRHLEGCPAAAYMLPLIYQLCGGNDKIDHPLSHFIRSVHQNAHLIRRYAYSIADQMDSFHRSKIHAELCEKLDLDYNKFNPFESSEIKEIPSRKEAEKILWEALFIYANHRLVRH